ncbi:hypothetical protein ACHAPJ_007538 [Fusarium lateritium]
MRSFLSLSLLSALPMAVLAQNDSSDNDIPFQGCGLIGAYYPAPTIDTSSDAFKKIIAQFTKKFDDLIKDGGSETYGPITANTTSFSVTLFGGAESLRDDPVFFEYHYTSPEDQASNSNVTSSTKFPTGDVSMIFTVYAWLVKMGEQWETPITEYLPELAKVKGSLTVPWEDVTIGALAGQMSGLSRESGACVVGEPCDWRAFEKDFAGKSPYFLPDTSPVVSYAAFQLLAFAMQRSDGYGRDVDGWASVLQNTLLDPLNMTTSGVLRSEDKDIFAIDSLNTSQIGEPGALSFVSSGRDLARAGHSILANDLLSTAVTRRWLHPNMDTSNLRNGVGRPWEVYRAGDSVSPIIDALTKSGTLGKYASYFGFVPEFDIGFSILAHDGSVEDRKLDLNVYTDIVSETIAYFLAISAKEAEARCAGQYKGKHAQAAFNMTENGYGLEVLNLVVDGVNVKSQTAKKLGIESKDLDFRVYPTNVKDEHRHQFVAVFQDRSAPIDAGTPTCITWQEVGAGVEINIVFILDKEGNAVGFEIPQLEAKLKRTA